MSDNGNCRNFINQKMSALSRRHEKYDIKPEDAVILLQNLFAMIYILVLFLRWCLSYFMLYIISMILNSF